MRRNTLLLISCLLLTATPMAFQMSPRDTAKTTLAGGTVEVEYGRPALDGRSVDELLSKLPEDRVWRTGSEQVTTLETTVPIIVGEESVPPGTYSVYVHLPRNGSYSLLLNKVLGQPLKEIWSEAPENLADEPWPHFSYEEQIGDQEVARAEMKQETTSDSVERFTISLEGSGASTELVMSWGTEKWSVDLKAAEKEGSGTQMREGSGTF